MIFLIALLLLAGVGYYYRNDIRNFINKFQKSKQVDMNGMQQVDMNGMQQVISTIPVEGKLETFLASILYPTNDQRIDEGSPIRNYLIDLESKVCGSNNIVWMNLTRPDIASKVNEYIKVLKNRELTDENVKLITGAMILAFSLTQEPGLIMYTSSPINSIFFAIEVNGTDTFYARFISNLSNLSGESFTQYETNVQIGSFNLFGYQIPLNKFLELIKIFLQNTPMDVSETVCSTAPTINTDYAFLY